MTRTGLRLCARGSPASYAATVQGTLQHVHLCGDRLALPRLLGPDDHAVLLCVQGPDADSDDAMGGTPHTIRCGASISRTVEVMSRPPPASGRRSRAIARPRPCPL